MSLISCKNATFSYDNTVALDNVTFQIDEGDYICVVGENGSGKSTLIKALLGLIPLKQGEINFNGLARTSIGYLPQQTVIQRDFPASVGEVVISGCLNRRGLRPFYSKKEKQIAKKNMEKLGIYNMRTSSYRELSGGQQQRVLLARALCATEKVLLLDEPVTGLDPIVTAELYGIIKSLNEEGVTIIMVSHDIACAVHQASKILHMGTSVRFCGPTEEYKESNLFKHFLGGYDHD